MRLFDIADDMTSGAKKNSAIRMLEERIGIYIKEDFPYEIIDVDFNI